MAKSIYELVDELPRRSLTVGMLQSLDWLVPGDYVNLVGFEETIRTITGETDTDYIGRVGRRAIELYNDTTQGYQRGLWIYRAADSVQGFAGAAAMVEKISESFSFLKWFGILTPKAEIAQSIDLGVKLISEVVAFLNINGRPGENLAEFAESLTDFRDEARMRLATLIAVDGILPLGPDFLSKAMDQIQRNPDDLRDNERFRRLRGVLPGDAASDQVGYVAEALSSLTSYVPEFITQFGVSQNRVVDSLRKVSDRYEGSMDYLAATIDMTTDYFEHTGTQTVARQLITRAVSEI